jgi:hypothetical protein
MHGASEAVRRDPLGHRTGFKERTIDLLRLRAKHSMEADGTVGHVLVPSRLA